MMRSCIFEGKVRHRRFVPIRHEFDYRLFMIYLDLNELPNLFSPYLLWSNERLNLAQFRRSDHIGDPSQPLQETARDLVENHSGLRPQGPIRLLTHLRYFGYRINPVSFFFCYDKNDENIEAIIAEINNTPWGEQHAYILDENSNRGTNNKKCYRIDKAFHISPFMPMDQKYEWNFSCSNENINIHMKTVDKNLTLFDATMNMSRTEISKRSLRRVILRYPFMTARVLAAIYWQAFHLWRKRTPFYPHPKQKAGKGNGL